MNNYSSFDNLNELQQRQQQQQQLSKQVGYYFSVVPVKKMQQVCIWRFTWMKSKHVPLTASWSSKLGNVKNMGSFWGLVME